MTEPLPAVVAEYVGEKRAATPDEVLTECDLGEARCGQVKKYLADTRDTLYKDIEGNTADGLRWDRVDWEDVADWTIP